jgi:hypothetical protein
MERINEAQRRASIAGDHRRPPRPRQQPSYAERYRGTEFETVKAIPRIDEPAISRGRAFVLITGTAALGFLGLVVQAALSG